MSNKADLGESPHDEPFFQEETGSSESSLIDNLIPVIKHRWKIFIGTILIGLSALGITYAMAPVFTSKTVFLPPQQQQSAAASALASLGALGGIAGAAAGIRSPGDQYVALLLSTTTADRLIDQFNLLKVYDVDYRYQARKELAKNVRIALGKKDNLITVEVDDEDPRRAADMANQHVAELRRLTDQLALTEAQQRRIFFEARLSESKTKLEAAQSALQETGFTQSALKAEPKAAAEGYARLKAELTSAEIKLQAMRQTLADGTPEISALASTVSTLRGQLSRMEQTKEINGGPGYIGAYREFKYQETLFDLFSRQYELARVDESREGPLIQIVDPAAPAERKSRPKRAMITLSAAMVGFLVLVAMFIALESWRSSRTDDESQGALHRLKAAWRGDGT